MAFSEITARRQFRSIEFVAAETEASIGVAQSIRHRAYVQSGAAAPNIGGRFADPLDGHPSSRIYLLREDRRTLGTIRLGIGPVADGPRPAPALSALEWFGPELREALPPGSIVLEAAHLAVEPTEDDAFLDVHDRLLRAAVTAAVVNEADALVLAVSRRHAMFYRRQWRMQRISSPRPAYGLSAEQCLMALPRGPEGVERLLAQRPWLRLTGEAAGEFVLPSATVAIARRHSADPTAIGIGGPS